VDALAVEFDVGIAVVPEGDRLDERSGTGASSRHGSSGCHVRAMTAIGPVTCAPGNGSDAGLVHAVRSSSVVNPWTGLPPFDLA